MTWLLKILAGSFGSFVMYGAAVVLVLLIGALGYSRFQLANAERDLAQCGEQKSLLESDLRLQNRAITELGVKTAAAQKLAARAAVVAEELSRSKQEVIDALQAQIVKPKATSCAPAIAEIRRLLK